MKYIKLTKENVLCKQKMSTKDTFVYQPRQPCFSDRWDPPHALGAPWSNVDFPPLVITIYRFPLVFSSFIELVKQL